jgi:transcriptional regulator with XRE-family HTH domain
MLSSVSSTAAETLSQIRRMAGLSQRGLAHRAGVPASTVSRIEAATVDPTVGMLSRLAAAAGVVVRLRFQASPHRLAQAVSEDGEIDWLRLRQIADWIELHPESGAATIGVSPIDEGVSCVSQLSGVILAAFAEKVADDLGVTRPPWTAKVESLPERWVQPGTPRMRERARQRTPLQFERRNLWLDEGAIWHLRVHAS